MDSQPLPKLQIVVFIVGTTGVGKSKLSLDLAKALNGEIINADSMQIYKGNEGTMTAKPTQEEKSLVKHHLYDIVEFNQLNFNVNKYMELALGAITQILAEGKLPIVVGGTNYYIESLLFDKEFNLPDQSHQKFKEEFDQESFDKAFEKGKKEHPKYEVMIEEFRIQIPQDNKQAIEDKFESEQLHELLALVDKKMSDLLHSKDKRKIVNALFKYFKYMASSEGQFKESDLQQLKQGLKMRFLPIIIQMSASKEILEQRIRKRIKQMIYEQGGLEETFQLFDDFKKINQELDFEKGILQAIGYKEFYEYYDQIRKNYQDSDKQIQPKTDIDRELLDQCIEKLVTKTLQYSQYQLKWLRSRIEKIFTQEERSLFLKIKLDDAKLYEQVAKTQALDFINTLTNYYQETLTTSQQVENLKLNYCNHFVEQRQDKLSQWQKYFCKPCQQELNGLKQWEEHIQTRKHYKKQKGDTKQKYIDQIEENRSKKQQLKQEASKEDAPIDNLFDDQDQLQ